MLLKIKYFGMVAEATDKNEEEFIFKNGTVNELAQLLQQTYPKLKALNYKFAINQSIIESNENLNENDEVALLPPFAGG